jgi:hypothetical protein
VDAGGGETFEHAVPWRVPVALAEQAAKSAVTLQGAFGLEKRERERERERGWTWWGLTREVETPLPSNHPECDQGGVVTVSNTIPCNARQCYGWPRLC